MSGYQGFILERGGQWRVIANGHEVSLGDDKYVPEFDSSDVFTDL
jgi:hypothetical protein